MNGIHSVFARAATGIATWALCCGGFGCRHSPPAPTNLPNGNTPHIPSAPQTANTRQSSWFFRDVARSSGLDFRPAHIPRDHATILDTIGHGCAFLDYDGDGRLDILLVGNTQARLYRNLGNGCFEDVSTRALPSLPSNAHFLGCSVADYDGDGRPDILLTGYGCVRLYHNRGDGTFRDVTAGSGLEPEDAFDWMTSAAWADVDGDGRLDVYVCRYLRFTPSDKQLCGFLGLDGAQTLMACTPGTYAAQKGRLFHNEGNGKFRDITSQAGLANTAGKGLGCQFCDVNRDGKPDLYVANDGVPCDLYLNTGKGTFRNIGIESGTAYGGDGTVQSGMGVDWGDYDNDGRMDLLVANFSGQPKSLYHNESPASSAPFFTNASYASEIGAASLARLSFGANFADYDNDGRLDIVFANGHVQTEIEKIDHTLTYFQSAQLFHNEGSGRFADVSRLAGSDFTRPIVGRGMAVGDYDADGKLDLLIVDDEGAPLLLHNEAPSSRHWLTLHCLQGAGKSDAIGAQITVTAGKTRQITEVRAGGSYLSANPPEAHFGLGSAAVADTIEIRWPTGRKSLFHAVAADHIYQAMPASDRLTPLK